MQIKEMSPAFISGCICLLIVAYILVIPKIIIDIFGLPVAMLPYGIPFLTPFAAVMLFGFFHTIGRTIW